MSQNIDDAINKLNATKQQVSKSREKAKDSLDYSNDLKSQTQMYEIYDQNMAGFMDNFSKVSDQRSKTIANYQNTLKDGGAYLGKNTFFSKVGSKGYITAEGVYKPYDEDGTVIATTSGSNGCPSSSEVITHETGIVYPFSTGTSSSDTGNLSFNVGTPMVKSQSCGNEGKNVFVDRLQDNPSSSFLGAYYDNIENPTISFIDNGKDSFTFDSCKKAAANYGYKYFSLQGVDPTNKNIQSVKCGLTNNVRSAERLGLVGPTSCRTEYDGKTYGGSKCVSLYKMSDEDKIGCFKNDESNPQLEVLAKNTDYNACKSIAKGQNYQYFALGPNLNDGATCYGSNNLSTATAPGVYASSSTYNDKTYGATGVNAIYSILSKSYPGNLGGTAYIDEDTKRSPYNLSNLSNSKTYSRIANYDTGINKTSLKSIPSTNPQDCATTCSNTNQCFAYTMNNETGTCQLYPASAVSMASSPPPPNQIKNNMDTYLAIPKVSNSSTCKKDVLPIDSVRFENYVPSGQSMTSSTLCGLGKRIRSQNQQISGIEKQMDGMFLNIGSMLNKVENYYENFTTFHDSVSESSATISGSLTALQESSVESTNKKNILVNDEMVNVSDIDVVQKNSMFIVWCIVATLFVLLAFGLLYKTLSTD